MKVEATDREQIRDVLVRWSQGHDRLDREDLRRSCLTEDTKLYIGGVLVADGIDEHVARPDITARSPKSHKASAARRLSVTPLDVEIFGATHFYGQTAFDFPTLDTAETETYVTVYLYCRSKGSADEKVHIRGIRYLDDFVRQDGAWLLRIRRHVTDFVAEAPLMFAVPYEQKFYREDIDD